AEAEELVPTESSTGRKSFRPRTEGSFARITRIQNEADDYWEVWSRNGWRSTYGQPRPTSTDRQWRDPSALHDPADPSKIFAWKISETKDTCGNLIRYSYLRDEDQYFQQLYPEKIEYADFPDDNGSRRFLVSVRFLYDN